MHWPCWGDHLLVDDFVLELTGRWTIETTGDHDGPAAWTFARGELSQASGVWGDVSPSGVLFPVSRAQ
jgi:hypothetical protein